MDPDLVPGHRKVAAQNWASTLSRSQDFAKNVDIWSVVQWKSLIVTLTLVSVVSDDHFSYKSCKILFVFCTFSVPFFTGPFKFKVPCTWDPNLYVKMWQPDQVTRGWMKQWRCTKVKQIVVKALKIEIPFGYLAKRQFKSKKQNKDHLENWTWLSNRK